MSGDYWQLSDSLYETEGVPEGRPDFIPGFGFEVFTHRDFLEWLEDKSVDKELKKKARQRLKDLTARGTTGNWKRTDGDNSIWLRAGLGHGTSGNNFYLWWGDASTMKGEFREKQRMYVRAVRFHDDTKFFLDPGDLGAYQPYLPEEVLFPEDMSEEPLSPEQRDVLTEWDSPIKFINGSPGSGKTTTLQQAAVELCASDALYITYSERLASDAQRHFAAFPTVQHQVRTKTFSELIYELQQHLFKSSMDANVFAARPNIEQFEMDVFECPQRNEWKRWKREEAYELYAEINAEIVGKALPFAFRGLGESESPIPDRNDDVNLPVRNDYVKQRMERIGRDAAEAAWQAAKYLLKEGKLLAYFPGPVMSHKILSFEKFDIPQNLVNFGSILLDEVQDLTTVEQALILKLVEHIAIARGRMPRLILAGDESQTVRPTRFNWNSLAELCGMAFGKLGSTRQTSQLFENQRSPSKINEFTESLRDLYSLVGKSDRPGGQYPVRSSDVELGDIVRFVAKTDDEWNGVLDLFRQTQGQSQLIFPGYRIPQHLKSLDMDVAVWTPDDAKGLEFSIIGIVDAAKTLEDLLKTRSRQQSEISTRTRLDQLRVSASRSMKTLVLLDREASDSDFAEFKPMQDIALHSLESLASILAPEPDHEKVANLHEQIALIIQDNPLEALRRSRAALNLAERVAWGDTSDGLTEQEGLDLRNASELWVAMSAGLLSWMPNYRDSGEDPDRLAQERDAAFKSQGKIQFWKSLEAVHDAHRHPFSDETLKGLTSVWEQYDVLRREFSPLRRKFDFDLQQWVRSIEDVGPIGGPSEVGAAVVLLKSIHQDIQLRRSHLDLVIDVEGLPMRLQELYFAAQEFEVALEVLRTFEDRDYAREAECHAALNRWHEAAQAWQLAGNPDLEVYALRQAADLDLALNAARTHNSKHLNDLEWLNELGNLLAVAQERTVSEGEAAKVRDLFEQTMGKVNHLSDPMFE